MAQVPPSASLARLQPPPSLSSTAPWVLSEKMMLFASEWYFKPEGVSKVKRRFESELAKLKLSADHKWNNDDQTFHVQCDRSNAFQIWPIFHGILQGVIREEGGEDWWSDDELDMGDVLSDAFDEDQPLTNKNIERLAFWKKKHGINDDIDENDEPRQPQHSVQFPDEVEFFKARFPWSCADSTLSLDGTFSDKTLITLSRLTGCQLYQNLNEKTIYIGAHTQELCHLAVSQLDNLRKYSESAPFYLHNIFYTEMVEDFRVSLRNFPRIKRKFFETTLIDNLQWIPSNCYDNLYDAFTIRCHVFDHLRGKYEPFKMENFDPAVTSIDDKELGFRDWIDFTYSGKGDPSENPMLHIQNEEQSSAAKQTEQRNLPISVAQPAQPAQPALPGSNKKADVERWVKQIPKAEPKTLEPLSDDSFKEPNGLSDRSGKEPAKNVENNKPSWDTYVSYGSELHDKVKNYSAMQTQSRLVQNIAALITAAQSIPAPPRPSVAQAALPCQIPATGMSPWPTLASPKKTQIHNIAAQSTPPKNAVPTPNNLTSSSPQTSLESGYLIGFLNHEPERRSLLDDTISTPDSAFAVLEPVRKSSATKLSSVLQPTTAVRSVSAVHSSFAAGEGNLSVSTIQVVHGTEPETLQKTSEVATRKFHNTMNQKAPNPNNKASKSNPKGLKSNPYASRLELPNPHRPQPRRQAASEVPQYQAPINAVDPLPEFLQEINTSFDEMMKGVRGFQGQVVVQAEFGRFILKRIDERYLSLRSRESSEDPETIQNVLQKGPFIFFTNIVTTIPAEIHYLIDMKDAAGTEMWEKKPARWTVSYEFLCRDTQSLTDYGYAPFMVEIDAETFVTQIKKRRPFGSINVHGTKRHWDFRIAAFGLESNEATEEAYGDFATALRLSLYIPSGLSKPLLMFEVPDSFSHFQIFGVRVRRVMEYSSKDSKSILKIHEVRDLDIEVKACQKKEVKVWTASTAPLARVGKDRLGFWHEVNISSAKADEVFEQNKKLELGGEAGWTPVTLAKVNAAQAMYLPACGMIKQMDGVGYWNENGVDSKKAMSTLTSASRRPPQQMVFW